MGILAGFYCGSIVGFLMGLLWCAFVSSSAGTASEGRAHTRR
jgi:hypothetical protein